MRYLLGLLSFILLLNSGITYAQEQISVSESRKKNLRQVLDYRFKGGFYSFEKLFNITVEYPPYAQQNCIMGIVIVRFEVNCDGVAEKVTMKNPIRYGIDTEITKFFNASEGHWNTCNDEKYTRFEVPIQFVLEGTETNTTDAMLIKEGDTEGFDCYDDAYYIEKAKKYLDKGKGRKALESINILILRNPFNNEYYEMREKAGSL